MKISKITKMLPVMLALMLMSPAMAENIAPGTATGQTDTDNAVLELNLPPFIDITTQTSNKESATTYEDDYSNIRITTPMSAIFQVITNAREGDTVKLTATSGTTAYNALRAEDQDTIYLVFSNTNAVPDSASVESAVSSSPASKDNPNAFAVKVEEVVTLTENSGATAPTIDYGTSEITYPLTNGIYTMTYTLDTKALNETFSTLDTDGKYQAKMILTQYVAP